MGWREIIFGRRKGTALARRGGSEDPDEAMLPYRLPFDADSEVTLPDGSRASTFGSVSRRRDLRGDPIIAEGSHMLTYPGRGDIPPSFAATFAKSRLDVHGKGDVFVRLKASLNLGGAIVTRGEMNIGEEPAPRR